MAGLVLQLPGRMPDLIRSAICRKVPSNDLEDAAPIGLGHRLARTVARPTDGRDIDFHDSPPGAANDLAASHGDGRQEVRLAGGPDVPARLPIDELDSLRSW